MPEGGRVALLVDSRRLGFREPDALSNRVANGLVASGVRPGDRASLFAPDCLEWIISFDGILKAGAEVSRAALIAHCREQLAAYKVPRGSTIPRACGAAQRNRHGTA